MSRAASALARTKDIGVDRENRPRRSRGQAHTGLPPRTAGTGGIARSTWVTGGRLRNFGWNTRRILIPKSALNRQQRTDRAHPVEQTLHLAPRGPASYSATGRWIPSNGAGISRPAAKLAENHSAAPVRNMFGAALLHFRHRSSATSSPAVPADRSRSSRTRLPRAAETLSFLDPSSRTRRRSARGSCPACSRRRGPRRRV